MYVNQFADPVGSSLIESIEGEVKNSEFQYALGLLAERLMDSDAPVEQESARLINEVIEQAEAKRDYTDVIPFDVDGTTITIYASFGEWRMGGWDDARINYFDLAREVNEYFCQFTDTHITFF